MKWDVRVMGGVRLVKKLTNSNLRMMSVERRRKKHGRAYDGRC